jgi:HK97 gp10 family phage protein
MARPRKRISGAARMRYLLRRLPDEVTDKVRQEIAAAAERVRAEAYAAIPNEGETEYSTGHLKRTFQVSIRKDGLGARVGWFGAKYRNSKTGQEARAAHAHLVEFGTAAGPRKAKDGSTYNHPGSKARPMLFPAGKKHRGENIRKIRRAMYDALRSVTQEAPKE